MNEAWRSSRGLRFASGPVAAALLPRAAQRLEPGARAVGRHGLPAGHSRKSRLERQPGATKQRVGGAIPSRRIAETTLETHREAQLSSLVAVAETGTMSNITDATCNWGLAQTADGCVRTLASYAPSAYQNMRIAYWSVGAVSSLACLAMYYRSIKYEGSRIQHRVFLLCSFASLTFIVRGADPRGYGHVIPHPIGSLLIDACTSALYTVFILALGYWATIIQQGAAVTGKPSHLKCLENSAIAVVWAFYIVNDMLLFLSKGFSSQTQTYVQLTVSAFILLVISTTFVAYGLRVHARLQEFERQRKLRMPSVASERMLAQSFSMAISDDEDAVPVMTEPALERRRPKNGHAAKIVKILVVAETVSIVVIAGQAYMAAVQATSTPVELSCANGRLCDTVKSSVSILHAFQVVCIWALLWTFRKINKKEVVPQPAGY